MTKKRRKSARKTKASKGISPAAYARHRKCAPSSVTRAIQDGRLTKSISKDARGRTLILDVERADLEWNSNTQRAGKVNEELEKLGVPSLAVSEARIAATKAAMAELEAERRRGRLIPVEEARAAVMHDYAIVRTTLLGVPARVRHRLPHLSASDVTVIDELIRKALEELANEDEADLDKG